MIGDVHHLKPFLQRLQFRAQRGQRAHLLLLRTHKVARCLPLSDRGLHHLAAGLHLGIEELQLGEGEGGFALVASGNGGLHLLLDLQACLPKPFGVGDIVLDDRANERGLLVHPCDKGRVLTCLLFAQLGEPLVDAIHEALNALVKVRHCSIGTLPGNTPKDFREGVKRAAHQLAQHAVAFLQAQHERIPRSRHPIHRPGERVQLRLRHRLSSTTGRLQ